MTNKDFKRLVCDVLLENNYQGGLVLEDNIVKLGGHDQVIVMLSKTDMLEKDSYDVYHISHSTYRKNSDHAFELSYLLDIAGKIGRALEAKGIKFK